MPNYFSLAASLLLLPASLLAQLLSPTNFLPHEHGQQFTPHHLLVDYVEHVAENSPRVMLVNYGATHEGRPLLLAFISAPENLARLEEIRENHLRSSGLLPGEADRKDSRAIVWLSFGVHGNEAGASESSMSALYELASESGPAGEWLKNTVVILDPCINPDGFSRYTHWYRGVASRWPVPEGRTYEHQEPWPSGRVNHYLFDLNRDWAWQTQLETRQRLAAYHQWMPHIHVDYHEQYPNSPYYFAPAAAPFHQYITDWQSDFQFEIGKNHARYFDQQGWLYFTRESFDLFYPSYGDTYPTFNGAIGMTYEQAGHGRAGRAIIMENQDTLTLKDRIAHHTTTALSTVEVASDNASRLVEHFQEYFSKAKNEGFGNYKTYIIRGDEPAGKLRAFCALLDKNQIRYGAAGSASGLRAFSFQSGREEQVQVREGDLIISAYQPMSALMQVLLEPEPALEDSLTYDITAWALPYAFGLEAYASRDRLEPAKAYEFQPYGDPFSQVPEPYAYLAEWSSLDNARFLSSLVREGVRARFAQGSFSIGGQAFEAGTLVLARADNRKLGPRFDEVVQRAAREMEQPLTAVQTGFSDSGFDLGSGNMVYIEPPRIALLTGPETQANSYGELWHFFEEVLEYPFVHTFDAEGLAGLGLSPYNTLIMPEGEYSLNESGLQSLLEWIEQGGRLIAIGQALSSLEAHAGFSLSRSAASRKEAPGPSQQSLESRSQDYGGQARREISQAIPGAIFKLQLDHSHPLAFGLGDHYYSLKTSSRAYPLLEGCWNVGSIGEDPEYLGFAGAMALEEIRNSSVFAVEEKGRGVAIYMVDNPLFRAFWENGRQLFSNALFFAGQ